MSKSVRIDLACEKCLKIRTVDKWQHGKLCKKCATLESGLKRRGKIRKRKVDLSGKTFGKLTVLKPARTNTGKSCWLCLCSCGKEILVNVFKILNDNQQSCGCHRRTQDGWAGTPTYKSWDCMKRRCELKTSNRWQVYGGRGIKVCDRWKVFLNFLEDMGKRPEGTSLERLDVNGNYCKENCRWATSEEQANNKRSSFMITAFGKTQTSIQWARETGIKRQTIEWRIKKSKLTPEQALSIPIKTSKK